MRQLIAPFFCAGVDMKTYAAFIACLVCALVLALAGIVGIVSGDYALTVIAAFFVIVMGIVARDEFRHAARARKALMRPPFTTEKG